MTFAPGRRWEDFGMEAARPWQPCKEPATTLNDGPADSRKATQPEQAAGLTDHSSTPSLGGGLEQLGDAPSELLVAPNLGARQEEPAWYPTSIPGRPWHTSRDRGVRAVRADEQLVPGDISVDGKVQPDGSITPWKDDARARPTLGQLSPDLQPALEELGAALDAADFAEALAQQLTGVVIEPITPEPITYESVRRAMEALGPIPPPPEPIKLTQDQIDALPKAQPQPFGLPGGGLFGTPVIKVDTVEESTPHQMAERPDPTTIRYTTPNDLGDAIANTHRLLGLPSSYGEGPIVFRHPYGPKPEIYVAPPKQRIPAWRRIVNRFRRRPR